MLQLAKKFFGSSNERQLKPFWARVQRINAMEPVIEALTTAMVRLTPDAYSQAREVAPGWDVYALEQEWRVWMADGGLDAPANPDKAFLGFCRKVFERRGRP